MTTFQDPPLQSRRAVRQQSEREQAPAAVVDPSAGATPLRPRRMPAPAGEVSATASGQLPTTDAGGFRARDFSPEGRQAASPAWAPEYGGISGTGAGSTAPSPSPGVTGGGDEPIEQTLTRRELRALRDAHGIAAAPEEAPVAPGTPLAAPSTRLDSALAEFDLLAAGRASAAPIAPAAPATPASPAPVPPHGRRAAPVSPPAADVPEVEVPVVEAPFVPASVPPEPVVQEPVAPASVDPLSDVPVQDVAPAAPVADAPIALVEPAKPGPAQVAPEVLGAPLLTPPPATAPVQQTRPVQPVEAEQPAESEVVVAEIVLEPTPEPAATGPATPTGHWSTQAQLDEQTQVGDAPLARDIGATSGAITTSALVLPAIPEPDLGPILAGDVMVTGSISLPASLSATGALASQLDQADLDHLLDPGDTQVATDSQPVRAIQAVSTHTSQRGVIENVKPKGTRGLTVLIIAATSMAVVVGALFIVLVATGQL